MNRATIVFALAAAVIFWAAALFGHANGFRINHTSSLSVGLPAAAILGITGGRSAVVEHPLWTSSEAKMLAISDRLTFSQEA